MSDPVEPIGPSALWPGGRLPATPRPDPTTEPDVEDREQDPATRYSAGVTARDAASIATTAAGLALVVAGSAVPWGTGGALLTAGLLVVVLGVLLGVT